MSVSYDAVVQPLADRTEAVIVAALDRNEAGQLDAAELVELVELLLVTASLTAAQLAEVALSARLAELMGHDVPPLVDG